MNSVFPLLLLASACAAPAPDTTWVHSDDPELGELVASVLDDVAERSGLELIEPISVRKRSREHLAEYLGVKLDEDLPPDEAERTTAVYALLGLAPADLDLRALLLSTYMEQVAGFYEPDSTALFLVDDQGPEVLEAVVVHEVVHALQDQHADLDALVSTDRGADRRIAAQAGIEGHATLVMMEWTMSKLNPDLVLQDLPDFSAMIRPSLAGIQNQYPALAEAPRIVQEGMLYPYLAGAGYVLDYWKQTEGRPSPLADALPESTEQVSDPARKFGPDPDPPVVVSFSGAEAVKEDGLGFMEIGVLLEEWTGVPDARDAAEGWEGDAYRLYGEAGNWSLNWAIAWESESTRDRFFETVGSSLPENVTAVSMEVDGVPVILFQAGEPPVEAITVSGDAN